MSPDPLFAITGDRYGYAGNDPVNGSDPTGLCGFLGGGPCTPGGIAHDVKHRGDQAARSIRHGLGICSTYADPGCESYGHAHPGQRDALYVIAGVALTIASGGTALSLTFGVGGAGLLEGGVSAGLGGVLAADSVSG